LLHEPYEWLNELALESFFASALIASTSGVGAIADREVRTWKAPLESDASELRNLAVKLGNQLTARHISALRSVADACDARAATFSAEPFILSMTMCRLRADPKLLGLVFCLSDIMLNHFHQRLDGLVATLVNVVLGLPPTRAVKAANVRSFLRASSLRAPRVSTFFRYPFFLDSLNLNLRGRAFWDCLLSC
jgi:hypothetical protein